MHSTHERSLHKIGLKITTKYISIKQPNKKTILFFKNEKVLHNIICTDFELAWTRTQEAEGNVTETDHMDWASLS